MSMNRPNPKRTQGPVVCIRTVLTVLALCSACPALVSAEEAEHPLNETSIKTFYSKMQSMNTATREGFEDLEIWLSYLDHTLTDDFVHTTHSYEQCASTPSHTGELDKKKLMDIYRDIGIQNFDVYEINLHEISIGEKGKDARVGYHLSIEDYSSSNTQPFFVTCDAQAHLIWDNDTQAIRVKKQACNERITIGKKKQQCDGN